MILIVLFTIYSFQLEINHQLIKPQNCHYLKTTDSITLLGDSTEILGLIIPLPGYYENLELPEHGCRFVTDPIAYKYIEIGTVSRLELHQLDFFPGSGGIFYLSSDLDSRQSIIFSREPLHCSNQYNITQFVLRPGDQYLDYLMELINTPFILTPRFTPRGYHQVDQGLGSDCASFAIYPHRRQGKNINYVSPMDIYQYLQPIYIETFFPQFTDSVYIFQSTDGDIITIDQQHLWPGDVIHLGEQVSVFYRDSGIPGILDSKDLIIQSWFNQPGIFSLQDCGFWGNPIQVYKWSVD